MKKLMIILLAVIGLTACTPEQVTIENQPQIEQATKPEIHPYQQKNQREYERLQFLVEQSASETIIELDKQFKDYGDKLALVREKATALGRKFEERDESKKVGRNMHHFTYVTLQPSDNVNLQQIEPSNSRKRFSGDYQHMEDQVRQTGEETVIYIDPCKNDRVERMSFVLNLAKEISREVISVKEESSTRGRHYVDDYIYITLSAK